MSLSLLFARCASLACARPSDGNSTSVLHLIAARDMGGQLHAKHAILGIPLAGKS
jgi:hypothetical protein